ncbi:MAG: GNAT family N-acetyltransferase [Gaiellaceae bacterium]
MIRPLNPETDAEGVVEIIHETFPITTTTVESWRQQHAGMPPRAKHAGWVAIVDGAVAGRGEAVLKWFSDSGSAFAGVSVRRAFRGRRIGASIWEHVERHLDELRPTHVTTMFVETPEGVAFARARGFTEQRAEAMSCVDPATVALPTENAPFQIVPLREVTPDEVYEVDMITTQDVPMTDAVNQMPFDEWLQAIWNRPTITLDGSFAAVADGRVVGFTILAANLERSRAFTEHTGTLSTYRNRGIAERVKRASLTWAAANGIRAAWTTNDETNAAMLAVNRRLGYTPRLRHVEYQR